MKFERDWLDLDDAAFRQKMTDWFRQVDKSLFTFKGSIRKQVLFAVDVVADYARYREPGNGSPTYYVYNPKWNALTGAYQMVFKEPAPLASASAPTAVLEWNLWAEKRKMLETKLALLKYWEKDDPTGFLQGDPADVEATLTTLLEDAQKRAGMTVEQWGHVSWRGIRLDAKGSAKREGLKAAVSGDFHLEAGAREKGEVTVEWQSAKGTFKYDAFGGLEAKGSGAASVEKTGIKANLEANVTLGLSLVAKAEVDTDYAVVSGELDVFAGALANGSAKLEVGLNGVNAEAKGSAFAGAKASAKGKCGIKWKGRTVFEGEATGEVSAGAGADGSVTLSVPIRGPVKFTVSGHAALGVGMGAGHSASVDVGNLRLSGEQFLYENVRQLVIPKERRYQLDLTLNDRQNQQLHAKVKEALTKLLGQVKDKESALQGLN
jgi:hypothetical protein